MSVAKPSPQIPQAVPVAVAVPGGGLFAARSLGLLWTVLTWAAAGGVALAIVIGVLVLVSLSEVSAELIAASILWMKFSVVAALYWCTAFRCFGHGGVALMLESAADAPAVELRTRARDKFSRASSLLGDMNLAMCFESFIVFFTLLAWSIFAFHAAALVLMILALPLAAGHWFLTIVIQDKLGDSVERA